MSDATEVTADDLTGPLIAGMPEVTGENKDNTNEFVGPSLPTPEITTNPLEKTIFPLDDRGNPFDPFTHKADENGKPLKNKKGLYYSKYIGRGGAQKKASSHGTSETNETPVYEKPSPSFEGVEGGAPVNNSDTIQKEQAIDEATGVALLAVPTFDGLMQTLFTGDVALTAEEMARINPFAANYIRSKGLKDVPPLAALALIVIATYAPKFAKPTVKERCVLFYMKIRNIFSKTK